MKISATRGLRNVDVVIKHLGDKPIDAYTSADAAALRDAMLEKGLSTAAIVIPLSKKIPFRVYSFTELFGHSFPSGGGGARGKNVFPNK